MTNRQILLVSRPTGEPTRDNFKLIEAPIAPLAEGQLLVRHHYLSLDPYMRGRMNDAKSYAPPQPLNEVMVGGTAGEVVESRNPSFKPGDLVVGMGGWQEYSVVSGGVRKVETSRIPLQAYLGPVGMPGVTAWYGLNKICEAKAGHTIAVSAASGAVGSVVGQLAKAKGCRAVGFAGGPDKCRYVIDELGFDACVDYKAHADGKSLYRRVEGGDARRHRRSLRKRRWPGARRRPAAHERSRAHRAVRDDQRLQRRADPDRSSRRCSSPHDCASKASSSASTWTSGPPRSPNWE